MVVVDEKEHIENMSEEVGVSVRVRVTCLSLLGDIRVDVCTEALRKEEVEEQHLGCR